MRPIAAAVATDEPEAAAKPAQAKLVATASPPGKPPNHSRAARNSADVMPGVVGDRAHQQEHRDRRKVPARREIVWYIGDQPRGHVEPADLPHANESKPGASAIPIGIRSASSTTTAPMPIYPIAIELMRCRPYASFAPTARRRSSNQPDQHGERHRGAADREDPAAWPDDDDALRRVTELTGSRLVSAERPVRQVNTTMASSVTSPPRPRTRRARAASGRWVNSATWMWPSVRAT